MVRCPWRQRDPFALDRNASLVTAGPIGLLAWLSTLQIDAVRLIDATAPRMPPVPGSDTRICGEREGDAHD